MSENKFLSQRIQSIKPSPTLEITALAGQLKQEKKDVVGFGAGEPDFDTPQHIKEACKKALDEGVTKYTPAPGTVSFREAVREKFLRDNNLTFSLEQVMTGTGGKQMLYNFIMSVIDPGDEVLIPTPYWVSYYDMVVLAEGIPKCITTTKENHFKMLPQDLEKAITPKTRALFMNSPSNPTGSVYSKQELIELANILEKNPHVIVVSDDIYEKLIYDGLEFYNLPMISELVLERSVIVNGLSKAFSMTGWRLGYAASKMTHIIKAMTKLQGQSTSNPTSFAQKGGETALSGDMSFLEEMKSAFIERRNYLYEAFKKMPRDAGD